MSTTEYLLNAAMLAFILITNLGTKTLTRRRSTLPLVLAGVLALIFLRHVPTIGNDVILEVTGALAGLVLGVFAALAVRLVLRPHGSVQATAGAAFASLWVLAIGGRMVFAYGADHWFPAAIATFSRAHEITGAKAWTAAFILMAVAMLAARSLVTQALATRLIRNGKAGKAIYPPNSDLQAECLTGRSYVNASAALGRTQTSTDNAKENTVPDPVDKPGSASSTPLCSPLGAGRGTPSRRSTRLVLARMRLFLLLVKATCGGSRVTCCGRPQGRAVKRRPKAVTQEPVDVVATSVRFRRGHGVAAALVALSVLLSACAVNAAGGSDGNSQGRTSPTTAPRPESAPAVLEVSPADQATGILPNAPVTVKASSGTLGVVTLVDAKGGKVPGQAAPDGTWTTTELLRPSTAYTFTVAATGLDGTGTSTSSTFTTLKPKVTATYALIPNGGNVGVGMPVIVQFGSAVITKAQRAEVEKRVRVTTVPSQAGAWGWLDNRQLMWRPKDYWLPGTKVTVSTPLHGLQTGADKWIAGDDGTSFTVGSAMVSTVDMKAHSMVVRRDGAVIRTIPVSTGKPGPKTETRFGTKVIIERNSAITMDSATVGIPKGNPDYYKIKTQWNLRLTWTGEFIHSAPWSTNAQGSQNVSHGCTNMSAANAQWMFTNSKMGDIVKFIGSSRPFQPTDGIGVWVYDFAGWKAQTALA